MISQPSALHVMPKIGRLSKVNRLGCPPFADTTYTFVTTPAILSRTKATCEPSGEKAGLSSRSSPGGIVNLRVVESASESSVIHERVSVPLFSGNASTLPSGDHVK